MFRRKIVIHILSAAVLLTASVRGQVRTACGKNLSLLTAGGTSAAYPQSSALMPSMLLQLAYAYCQQGRYASIEQLLQKKGDQARLNAEWYESAAAIYLAESGRWAKLPEFFRAAEAAPTAYAHHGTHGGTPSMQVPTTPVSRPGSPSLFVRAMAAAVLRKPEASSLLNEMRSLQAQAKDAGSARIAEIHILEITALQAASKKNFKEAIENMKKATALEIEGASSSPLKPAHELFGEILLRAGRPKDAMEQFAISLRRHPNRARSLLGAARAAVVSENKAAAIEMYRKFLGAWSQADPELPELREAREFLGKEPS